MGRYILKRLWHGAIVILGVTVIVFVVTRMIGDPVKLMLPLEATLEQRAAFEKQLGLDRPIPVDHPGPGTPAAAASQPVAEHLPLLLRALVRGAA